MCEAQISVKERSTALQFIQIILVLKGRCENFIFRCFLKTLLPDSISCLLSKISGHENIVLKQITNKKNLVIIFSLSCRWEVYVKFLSPQNSAGVSQDKGIAVISQTIVVNGDQFSKKQTNKQKTFGSSVGIIFDIYQYLVVHWLCCRNCVFYILFWDVLSVPLISARCETKKLPISGVTPVGCVLSPHQQPHTSHLSDTIVFVCL